jgi:hypothetical protein
VGNSNPVSMDTLGPLGTQKPIEWSCEALSTYARVMVAALPPGFEFRPFGETALSRSRDIQPQTPPEYLGTLEQETLCCKRRK